MPNPVEIRVDEVQLYIRNMRTRMPFRYGKALLRFAPILHVRLSLESKTGQRAWGEAADILPPKWFDKDPGKSFEHNIEDLLWAARTAAHVYLGLSEQGFHSVFRLWLAGYHRMLGRADEQGQNHLTAGHGSSLMERAVIDAVGRMKGVAYPDLVLDGLLGIEPEAVHADLAGLSWRDILARSAGHTVFVRHTVGFTDALATSEIPAGERLRDGLPQSLQEYLLAYDLRYFKIKLSGDCVNDAERLRNLALIMDRVAKREYSVSLDGNEQYTSVSELAELIDCLRGETALRRFFDSVLYIEQPFSRELTSDRVLHSDIERLTRHVSIIIDEADSDLSSFREAAALGYQGVSAKNCKGIIKTIMNRLLVEKLNQSLKVGQPRYFLSAEDLMNAPAVALHQDLTALAFLGIRHAERNAYHYMRGLDHLTPREQRQCLSRHRGLYVPFEDGARLNIDSGRLDLRSLRLPGMGVGVETDYDALVPLERWSFQSLLEGD